MKTIDSFNITPDIRAKKSEAGIWYLRHEAQTGMVEYSTGMRGSRTDIRTHAKEAGIPELVALVKTKCLTEDTIQMVTSGKKVKVMDILEEWCDWMLTVGETIGTVDSLRKRMLSFISHYPKRVGSDAYIGAVTLELCSDWVNPEGSSIKLSTRRARLTTLKSFFKFCIAKGYTITNPAGLVRINMRLMTHEQKEVKKQEAFAKHEYQSLLSYIFWQESILCDELNEAEFFCKKLADKINWLRFWGMAIAVSYETGLRLGDCAQLEWECIGEDGITVWTDKRDRRVHVPWGFMDIPKLLKRHIPKESGTGYIFPKQAQLVLDGKSSNLSVYFKRLCKEAEVHGKSFHGFRRSRIARWSEQDLSLDRIAELVGHGHTSTTEGYL